MRLLELGLRRFLCGCVLVFVDVTPAPGFAEDLIISEFLAANRDGLADVDGDRGDWVELHNSGPDRVALAGWALTDDPERPAKWVFPAVSIEPDGFLVVFASGKDRAAEAEELHTNFRLDAGGEYLALVSPSGAIAQQFAPQFPPQREDVSYGFDVLRTTLVGRDAEGSWWIPEDDGLGFEWTAPDFDGVQWVGAGKSPPVRVPLGYSVPGSPAPGNFYSAVVAETPGLRAYWRLGETDGGLAHEETGLHAGRYVGEVDGGAAGAIVGDANAASDFREGAVVVPSHELLRCEGTPWSVEAWVQPETIDVPFALILGRQGSATQEVDYLLEVFRRNRFRFLSRGNFLTARVDESFVGKSWFHVVAVQDPIDTMEKLLYVNGELVVSSSWRLSNEPTLGKLPLEIGGRAGDENAFVGRLDEIALYGRALGAEEIAEHYRMAQEPDGFGRFLATDVEASLSGAGGSLFLRLPFEVADPLAIAKLTLNLRYQDGFVAYINGREIARRNAPEAVVWNSTALRARASQDVLASERVDVSAGIEVLRAGRNVLALQGLKETAGSPSFLLAPRLDAESVRELASFVDPSPGLANRAGVVGFLEPIRASVARGFFDAPFDVELESSDDGASIRYTLDGSAPSATNGVDYEGPFRIETTTVLRAIAVQERYQASSVQAWTYLFPADVVRQSGAGFPERWRSTTADYAMDPRVTEDPRYRDTFVDDLKALPILSVSLAPDDLFGPNGLYSNPESRGRSWERRAAIEFFEADGDREFHVEAGLRMHGGSSRSAGITPQHSLRLHFRREYGAAKLEFPLFPGAEVERFDTLVISANSSDNWTSANTATGAVGQFIRDQWARDVQREMGHAYVAGMYVHLFLDGLYWGLYNITERVDDGLAAEHFGGSKEEYDVIVDGAATSGDEAEWRRLLALARQRSVAAVEPLLDVDNLIDYLLINMFTGNWDWPDHNWNASRRRVPEGRFRFFIWDSEVGLGLDVNIPGPTVPREFHVNLTGPRADVGAGNIAGGPGELYNLLQADPDFRRRFSDHLHRHLRAGGVLTAEQAIDLYEARADEIRGALSLEAARWGDVRRDPPDVPDGLWSEERRWIVEEFLPLRPGIVLEQFREHGLYDGPEEGGAQLPGDLDQDGSVQLADAIALLESIFRGVAGPSPCPRASDAQRIVDASGDGRANLVDVIHLLTFVLGRGPAPHAGPECLPMAGCREVCGGP